MALAVGQGSMFTAADMWFRTSPIRPSVVAVAAVIATSANRDACADPQLEIAANPQALEFRITGGEAHRAWVLQHSADGRAWEDLLFLKDQATVTAIDWRELPARARGGLFRAIGLESDDPRRRDFLEQRSLWRRTGPDSYRYELRQFVSFFFWHVTITVVEGEVTSFETIAFDPAFFEPSDPPTIDDLFGRIASAIADNAETIDVTWDPVLGYPSSCFIDISELIADEEQSWTIESLTVL